ncbi:capsular polysaccharide export protein, LipB/KpsS family [Schinkia azotoformans]|uniref:capsular polysaccharide export protein, LipB/KpsS family n=1 Tax=Schinkia azotoformans TaxID=1454 RepID=UPI002DB7FCEF|nr:hypothetical protein [Schinkia azotoformans]MEC1719219.1 hypothetical protein [Schinkia azotoformans]MED4413425.1 hypothetical protein [Schinkia azotoformans]
MNIYLKNYWSIYREFLETFKNLTFKDIPLCLMTNFYQHIDQSLQTKMEEDTFPLSDKYPEMKYEMIQPYFDKWLNKGNLTLTTKLKNGKLLINSDYTRIPATCYRTLFDPEKTIILSRSNAEKVNGIPNETMKKYEENTEDISNRLIKIAKSIFRKLDNHPAFSNEFFQETFLNRIPLIVRTINAGHNLFQAHKISVIIVGTTEDIVSRTLAIVGRRYGIKSICLQHGILMGEEAFLPVFTKKVAVYGEYEKNWYLKRGLTPDRISEIGHPKYDQIFTRTTEKNHSLFDKFKLDTNKITLLVITGPNMDPERFTKLIENLIKDSRYQLIIKPHPWEIGKQKCQLYFDLEKKYESIKVWTIRGGNLYELIDQVDGVIGTLSTAILESILLKKPVFIFNFIFSNRTYEYYDQFGKHIQIDPNQLYAIIDKYYTVPEQKQDFEMTRDRFLGTLYLDGNSGQKLLFECCQNEDSSVANTPEK